MDKKKTFIIFAVSVIFLIIFGSIIASSSCYNSSDTASNNNNPKVETGTSATAGDFKKKLVGDEYLLVTSSLTWEAFGKKLKEGDDKFINEFSGLFNDLKWNGLFFECKAFKPSAAKMETIEFRLIKSDSFDGMKEYNSEFDEHFKAKCPSDKDAAVSFLNLKKTSALVSPCPKAGLNGSHIKSFMKSSTFEQKRVLLGKVGEILLEKIAEGGDKFIWLSTSGLGVSWLHVRFDPSPDYYTTVEYK